MRTGMGQTAQHFVKATVTMTKGIIRATIAPGQSYARSTGSG